MVVSFVVEREDSSERLLFFPDSSDQQSVATFRFVPNSITGRCALSNVFSSVVTAGGGGLHTRVTV